MIDLVVIDSIDTWMCFLSMRLERPTGSGSHGSHSCQSFLWVRVKGGLFAFNMAEHVCFITARVEESSRLPSVLLLSLSFSRSLVFFSFFSGCSLLAGRTLAEQKGQLLDIRPYLATYLCLILKVHQLLRALSSFSHILYVFFSYASTWFSDVCPQGWKKNRLK